MDTHAAASGENIELRVEYDWSATSASAAVVDAVTRATAEEHTTFGPLYESVDPDALDKLFEPGEIGSDDTTLSFRFADRQITVQSCGAVVVRADGVE